MAPRPSWRLAAVVLVALVGLSAWAALRDDDAPAEDPAEDEAATDFLAAWARSTRATFRSVSEFRRTSTSTGAELTDRLVVAQRPPDRLALGRTGGRGLVDGRRLLCTVRAEELQCEAADAERTYDEDAARRLARLEEYVSGPRPLYAVAEGEGGGEGDCFALRLARTIPAPPLGEAAHYCFDPATGAPTSTRIERVEATDEYTVVELEPEVTDADLDPETAWRDL